MCSVIDAIHVRGIRVNTRTSPTRVSFLREGRRFYHLRIANPHYDMTILRKHVSLSNVTLRYFWHVVFYSCWRGIRHIDTRCIEHLNHQAWTVKPNRSLWLKIYSRLAASRTVMVHIVRSHITESICPTCAADVQSTDISHSIVKCQLKCRIGWRIEWADG
jgi:hypothetical protein